MTIVRSELDDPASRSERALADPLAIGKVLLRNRVICAPMDRNYCLPDGRISDQYVAYLEERARGGAALIFPEAALVRADGRSQRNQMALDTDAVLPDLTRLVEAVHKHGALLGVQLNHGGNTSKPEISGFRPVAPSAVRSAFTGGPVPDALEVDDIHHLLEAYADAAERSVAAGVDVIMIHAAHGYLIHQFMMPSINKRADEYGDPARFLSEVLSATCQRVSVPVVLRVSAFDGVEGGLGVESTLEVLRRVPTDYVDCIDVTAGSYEAPDLIIPAGEREPGWLASIARRFREFGKPVGVAGRITTTELAADIVRRGDADLVSIARSFHADPTWASSLLEGTQVPQHGGVRTSSPRPCIACNVCIDELGAGPVRCTVNPRAGREYLMPELATPSERPRTGHAARGEILVVGAGPAGLETAFRLVRSARKVRIIEQAPFIGGQFALAAKLKGYPEYHRILDWYRGQLEQLDVQVELETKADVQDLLDRGADAVVLATGSIGLLVDVPGADLGHVHDLREWLRTSTTASPGSVVIWGGDREAMAVGDDLASRGAHVTFVFGGATLGRDVGRLAKPFVTARLETNPHVQLVPRSAVVAIEPDHIRMRDAAGLQAHLAGPELVLISQGAVPVAPVIKPSDLVGRREDLPGGLWTVGDAAGQGGSVVDVLAHALTTVSDLLAASA